ncbi:hypothetical protein WI88_27545 [Burkholderia ubonensis]|nr:hypothetical protein WI88_27545 [Burkholderia ubonensis]
MSRHSLFAEQEREARLDKIGDALSKLGEHVDFAVLAEVRFPLFFVFQEASIMLPDFADSV